MKSRSIFDEFLKGLGDAVTDIREKVVEEPWYGRVVNERDVAQAEPVPEWPQAQEHEPEFGSHTHYRESDFDIER